MKNVLLGLSLLVLFFFTSCKYDQTCEGTYTGTYSGGSPTLPVPSGSATVLVTLVSNDHYDITFTSSGNPDLIFTNIEGKVQSSIYGAYFTLYSEDLTVSITEVDAYDGNWSMNFYLYNINGSLSFYGNRVQ